MRYSMNPGVNSGWRRRLSARWLGGAIAAATLLAPGLAEAAEKILILQVTNNAPSSNAAGTEAATLMTDLGYDVTLLAGGGVSAPANVNDYAQVYLISIGPLDDTSAQSLVDYVKAGGHLYVTGERPSNEVANTIVQDKILKPILVNGTGLQVGTGIEGGNGGSGVDPTTLVAERTGFAFHPNILSTFYVNNPGIVGGVADDHIFAKDALSRPIGALWTHEDLVQGTGCVALVMDINWWGVPNDVTPSPVTHADLMQMTANFHDFLKYCGDHDLDGILDSVEGPLGTDPANPDSDGDGLCDGKVAVNDPSIPQTCIAGEDAVGGQNTDGDGKIDALDDDDDNDGILTKTELADATMFGEPDTDNVPAWLDTDSDGDGVSDMQEGRQHFSATGVPDYLDPNYPTPQPTSSSTAAGGGAQGSNTSNGATGTSSGVGGGGTDSGDGGGCGCVVADSEDSPAQRLGWVGFLAGFAALIRRSSRRAPKK